MLLPTPPTGIKLVSFVLSFVSTTLSASTFAIILALIIENIMNLLPVINLLVAMTITSTSYSRELLDFMKININETKHSGHNNTPIFELV